MQDNVFSGAEAKLDHVLCNSGGWGVGVVNILKSTGTVKQTTDRQRDRVTVYI